MSDVDAMIAWLRAQIQGDKAAAEAVKPATNLYPPDPIEFLISGCEVSTPELEAAERHLRRHDPRDVIADCDAKLAIIDAWPDPFGNWSADQADAARTMKERTVRLLAQGYRFRDGWREDWAA